MAKKKGNDNARKALLLGLGAASYATEAVESAISQLRKDGDLDEQEARALLRQVISGQKAKAQAAARKQLEAISSRNPLATKADLARLEARLKKLESAAKKKTRK